jgi:AcrR family transcriptional regulator
MAYGLVYHYFGSKESLLETIFRRTWKQMLRFVWVDHRPELRVPVLKREGPYGIRTRAAAVRGRCPRPLDEWAVATAQCSGALGLNPRPTR